MSTFNNISNIKICIKLNFLLLLQYCYMLSTESYFLGGELAKLKLRTRPYFIGPAEKMKKMSVVLHFPVMASGNDERRLYLPTNIP